MSMLAVLFAIPVLWALVSGRAYWINRTVTRDEDPWRYWTSVAACAAIAWMLMSLGPVR